MTPLGNNIKIKIKPVERVLKSGIILPDTVTQTNQQWGVVLDGNGHLPDGWRVLFFSLQNLVDGEETIVSIKKCLYWHEN